MATAQPLGQMIIELGLDSSNFSRGMKGVNQQIKTSVTEMKAHLSIMGRSGDEIDKLKTKQTGLSSVIAAQNDKVSIAKTEYEACKAAVEGNAEATQKQKDALIKAQNVYVKAVGELGSYENQLKDVNIRLDAMRSSFYQVGESLVTLGGRINKAGEGISSVGKTLTIGVSAPLLAVGTASIKAASEWESAFAGVKKTVDEIVDANGNVIYSYGEMEEALLNMSERIPATTTEIAAVAEAAGQLGIATDNVVSFSEVMINLGNTTNLGAEEAASSLAKVINITGMASDDYERLGSSIVALGNNMATTEADIVSMATRMASAGTQAGMAETDILAVAAAMSSLGMESQAGGSAMARTFNKINSAVISGGDELNAFADVAKMSSTEFQQAWKEDAAGALVYLVAGLSEAGTKGEDLAAILGNLGIESTNDVNAMMSLATSSTVLANALEISRSAWQENTALTAEAEVRYKTFESQLILFKNEVGNVAKEVGGPLMEAASSALESAAPLLDTVKNLAQSFTNASPETQLMAIQLGLVAVAAGPVLTVTGQLISGVGSLTTSLGNGMKSLSLWAATMTNSASATAVATAANNSNTASLSLRTAKVLVDTAATKVHTAIGKAENIVLMASTGKLTEQVIAQNTVTATKIKDTAATVTHTIAEKARNIVTGISTGAISLQTIATVAQTVATGACTVATGLLTAAIALLFSPITLIVGAIGLLVTGIVLAVKWMNRETEASKKLKSETEELTKANEGLIESMDTSQTSYDDHVKSIHAEAAAAQALADDVTKLSRVENKTASQKKELAAYVNMLNGSMEGLNLRYDEQSDAISMTTEEINLQISALEKQAQSQAAQERLTEIYRERKQVSEQLTQVQDKITEATENTTLRERERKILLEELTGQETELKGELESLGQSYQNVTGIITESAAAQAEAATESTLTILEAYGSIKNAYDDLGKKQQEALDSVVGTYEVMTGKLSDLTEKIKLDDETTWQKIRENQADTIAKTQEFSDLYAQLIQAGVSESYLQAIGATGPKSIPLLKQMVAQGTDTILETQAEWQKAYGVIGNSLVGTLKLDDGVKEALKNYVLGESGVYGSLQGAIEAADLNALGLSITQGVSAGIIKNTDNAKNAATDMADDTTEAAEEAWGIHSPSRVFREMGQFLMDGLTQGLSQNAPKAYAKSAEIANQVTSIMKKALDIHSPSGVMRDEVGKNIALGIAEGITQNKKYAKKSAEEIADAVLQAAKKKLDNTKVYTELTLADETAYWKEVSSKVKAGTQAKIDADKEYFQAKKALNQKMVSLETDYTSKVKKVYESLDSSIKSLQDSYQKELASRTKSIVSSMGLFDEFTAKTELSTADLLSNLKSQVTGLQEWSSNLRSLEKRGVKGDMLEELRGMGTDAAGEIALMTEMTDQELKEYIALWKQKQRLARKEATRELEPLLADTEMQITQMRAKASQELEEYKNEFVSAMAEIGVEIQKPIDQIQTSLLNTMASVVQVAAGTISTEADKQTNVTKFEELAANVFSASETLPAVFTQLGKDTVAGLIQGLQERAGDLSSTMTDIIRAAIQAAKDEAQIHSPSKAMASIGSYMMEGLGIGMDNMKGYVEGVAGKITGKVVGAFRTGMNAEISLPEFTLTDKTDAIQSIQYVMESVREKQNFEDERNKNNEAGTETLLERLVDANDRTVKLLQKISEKDLVIDKTSLTDAVGSGMGGTGALRTRFV